MTDLANSDSPEMLELIPADKVRLWISSITFNSGAKFSFSADDITVVVGPNNAGKSELLRSLRQKLEDKSNKSPVVTDIEDLRRGLPIEFDDWLMRWTIEQDDGHTGNPILHCAGLSLRKGEAQNVWPSASASHNILAPWFCLHLRGEQRLSTSNPAPTIQLATESPTHPIHFIARDDALERRLSDKFRRAFDRDLIVHRNAGNNFPLYVGERPIPCGVEDRVSLSFLQRLEKLPRLHEQGDGMRSFASVLLATSIGKESILLIDEPEAFLHPPQAKLLGQTIVAESSGKRQLFIATHSTDVLKGALDSNNQNIKILRIVREGDTNRVSELSNDDVRTLWSDSLLRYSNILDGLFHECVVVCEADSDCSFYSAVAGSLADIRVPDAHFVHCGGKARIPVVLRALAKVGLPVKVVCDFDVLQEERPLRDICETLACPWVEVERDWKIVKSSIDSKRPDRTADEVKKEIGEILDKKNGLTFTKETKAEITKVLRLTSAWSIAKTVGTAYVPAGDASQAVARLLIKLRSHGIHVVEVGEVEGFVKSVPDHGPKWAAEVLTRDLKNDSELAGARKFVSEIFRPRV